MCLEPCQKFRKFNSECGENDAHSLSDLEVNESHDEKTQRGDSKLFWAASQVGSVRQAWAGDKRRHLSLDIRDLTRRG